MSQSSPIQNKPSGCLTALSSWVLPCISPSFYANATRRRTVHAVGFFVVFTLVLTLIESSVIAIALGHGAIELFAALKERFQPYPIPTITISADSISIVGIPPLTLLQDFKSSLGVSFSLALTPQYIAVRFEDFPVHIAVNDLRSLIGNSTIVLSEVTIAEYLAIAVCIGWGVSIILLLVWNMVIRCIITCTLSVFANIILWLVNVPQRRFRSVMIVGLYATVPAVYLGWVIELLLHKGFAGLSLVLQILIWAVALFFVFRPRAETTSALS